MHTVQSCLSFLEDGASSVFPCLAHLPPGMCVDVGAAAGMTVQSMLQASPNSTVIAFEPFPGNYPFLEAAINSDPRVKIVKKAVANHDRDMAFHVPSIVKDGSGAWKGMDGYSSGGQLVAKVDPRSADSITVQTTRIDDEIDGPVNLIKIDVQGSEYGVLDGARQTFDHGVNIVIAEFTGDERVLDFFSERGFHIYDAEYLSSKDASNFGNDWNILRTGLLSTGIKNPVMTPRNRPDDLHEYSKWLKGERRRVGSVWTDLICIAPDFHETFIEIAKKTG